MGEKGEFGGLREKKVKLERTWASEMVGFVKTDTDLTDGRTGRIGSVFGVWFGSEERTATPAGAGKMSACVCVVDEPSSTLTSPSGATVSIR